MKFNNHIAEIEIYSDCNKYNNKSCIPICYRIIKFTNIVDNSESEYIFEVDSNHTCIVPLERNNYQITPHTKILSKNNVVIYENICNFTGNKIIKNINLDDSGKIQLFITNKLNRAYIDKEIAFYEDFIKLEQWNLFSDGYSGLYKEYDFTYSDNGYLDSEYYHINGKINGKKKIYCKYCGLITEENYINNIKYGCSYYYKHHSECIIRNNRQIRNYFSDNYYYLSEYDDNMNIIKSGYYYMDINISWIVQIMRFIKLTKD
jgi:hypothetical protein